MGKECLRCGRLLYVNDYCKKCSKELMHENLLERLENDPSLKPIIDGIFEHEQIMVEAKKKYSKERRHKYKDLYIAERLRNKVRIALKSKSEDKLNTKFDLIGCSINDLKVHLENKFQEGMTWDNYGNGGWHIDHIIPCQDFDLTIPDEQNKCFHYKNLQPLWAMDNFNKNGKHNRGKRR